MFVPRHLDELLDRRLHSHGAVAIEGPKACGKTTTGLRHARSAVHLDDDAAARRSAEVDPRLVLDGATPRLLDEYQVVPSVWNAVRHEVDRRREKGQFILTGSATPADDLALHTGAARIGRVRMRTLTLSERRDDEPTVSLADLLAGGRPSGPRPDFDVAAAATAVVVGGWPENLDSDVDAAIDVVESYLDLVCELDVSRVDSKARDPDLARRIAASYARNTATSVSLASLARADEADVANNTLVSHLTAFRRLFILEDQPAWKPSLRSRVRLAATPKRHMADPSLAAAALRCDAERLLGPEIELLGFLFESLVVHDLRVLAELARAEVRHYRDNTGLEVDAIVEARDGRWIGVEVKLGNARIDAAAASLRKLHDKVDEATRERCGALVVMTADSYTYTRDDDVVVMSVAALGP